MSKQTLKKQSLYITSLDNIEHWGGYLPGTDRNGFTRKTVMVKNVVDEGFGLEGEVTLKKVTVKVEKFGSDWTVK